MLNEKAVIPLYVQLMQDIENKITQGIYLPGERLQTETEMAKVYGVSIVTVRNAIGELIDKGMVERKQGKGTFVAKSKFVKDVGKLQSFSDMCKSMGVTPGGKMLENKIVVPDKSIGKKLSIEKGQSVVFISRVRFADKEPVVIEKNYFPLKYSFLLGETFDNNSLFEFIKEKTKLFVLISEKRIEICRASTEEAEIFKISKGDPLLLIKSIAYSKKGEPFYVGVQIINSDRLTLSLCESTDGFFND